MDEASDDFWKRYGSFYERQRSKDCLIHSFNNAFGYHALDKKDVLQFIHEQADSLHADMCKSGQSHNVIKQQVNEFLDSVMTNNTYFTSPVVWGAAHKKGLFTNFYRVPGFTYSNALKRRKRKEENDKNGSSIPKAVLPEWALRMPMVVLGVTKEKSNHAIAIRDGKIYDSENKGGAVPYTYETLLEVLPVVHGAFVFEGVSESNAQ